MAESTKLTKEQLKKIITEELGELDEGFLDRMMAKITATGSGAKTSVGNIAKQMTNPVRRLLNKPELQQLDPKLVKQMTVLTKRMNQAGKQVAKLYNDIWNDYQNLKKGMDDAVSAAAAEIIEPVLGQAKEAGGAMVGVGLIAIGRRDWSERLPYGPYISLAAVIWIFFGQRILAVWLPEAP